MQKVPSQGMLLIALLFCFCFFFFLCSADLFFSPLDDSANTPCSVVIKVMTFSQNLSISLWRDCIIYRDALYLT